MPSLNENYGHAVAESIAFGRPVVVSNQTVWSTMQTGPSVACLPLDISAWTQAAANLLSMDSEDIIRLSSETYHHCLLDPLHLEAQRTLFAP